MTEFARWSLFALLLAVAALGIWHRIRMPPQCATLTIGHSMILAGC